jgi:hypothetical protein
MSTSIPCMFDVAGTNGDDVGRKIDLAGGPLPRVLLLLILGCKLIATSKLKLAAMTKASVTARFKPI